MWNSQGDRSLSRRTHLRINDQLLMNAINDDSNCQRLQNMLEQDQKNLKILETVIIQYGVRNEPKETAEQNLEAIQNLMEDSGLTLSEKVFQQELLKHQKTMTGLVIYKAAQIVGSDVEAAIAPLQWSIPVK